MRKYLSVLLLAMIPMLGWGQTTPTTTPSLPSSNCVLPNSINWSAAGQNYNYAGRHFHSSAVMNNRVWVMGGLASNTVMADVLSSADGLNWSQATTMAAFGPRWGQASLAFNAGQGTNLFVIGGCNGKTFLNDVWQSTDGANWTLVTANAPFTARAREGAVVFQNKIWIIGGTSAAGYLGDIWNSPDGKNWTQVTPKETFPARYSEGLVVYHNALWLIAGQSAAGALNDVWMSADGVNWTNEAAPAFGARSSLTSEVYKGRLWIFGGHDVDNNSIYNDAWWTSNGSQWNQSTPSGNYTPRWAHASAVFNDEIWIINGCNGPKTAPVDYSDIWDAGCAPPASGLNATATVTPTSTSIAAAVVHTLSGATPVPNKTSTPAFTLTATPTPVWTALPITSNLQILSAMVVPHLIHAGKPVKLLLNLSEPAQVQWTISNLAGQQVYQISQSCSSGMNNVVWQGTNLNNQPAAPGVYSYSVQAQAGGVEKTTNGKFYIGN